MKHMSNHTYFQFQGLRQTLHNFVVSLVNHYVISFVNDWLSYISRSWLQKVAIQSILCYFWKFIIQGPLYMKTVQNLMEISKISFSIQIFYVLHTFFSYKHAWSGKTNFLQKNFFEVDHIVTIIHVKTSEFNGEFKNNIFNTEYLRLTHIFL